MEGVFVGLVLDVISRDIIVIGKIYRGLFCYVNKIRDRKKRIDIRFYKFIRVLGFVCFFVLLYTIFIFRLFYGLEWLLEF